MVLGMRHTRNLGPNERSLHWRLGIHNLYPNANPFLHVITRTGKETVSDPEYKMHVKGFLNQQLVATGAPTGNNVPVTAGDAFKVRTGYILINGTTLTRYRVTADPTANNQVTMVRLSDGSAPSDIANNHRLRVIGTAHEEGADVPRAVSYTPTVITNYLQIFRNSTDNTNTARASTLRTGPISKEAKREALFLHETDKEMAFLFGLAKEEVTANSVLRTTGGLATLLTTNVRDFGGTVTMSTWNSFLADVFMDGSDEKLLLCGATALRTLEGLARQHSQFWMNVDKRDSFGIDLRSWVSSFGTLYIKQHRLLSRSQDFSNWGFVIDTEYVGYRYLKGRDTEYYDNRQSPGADRVIGEWLAEVGLEVMQESTCGFFRGATNFGT